MPHAVEGGAIAIDKSAAYRLQDGIPLVVPEVNGIRAIEGGSIIANPNCCTIPLTCVLKPLHEEAGLARVRVATYQSVSGAGAQAMDRLENEDPREHDLRMDWDFDGEEFDEESKLRAETRKIMELPDLPIQATCVRVPVMVGHAEAIWVEFEDDLPPSGRASSSQRRRRCASRSSPRPGRPPASTRCWSAGFAATRRSTTALRSSSRATTCARAPRSTRSRSPSSYSPSHIHEDPGREIRR